MVIPFALTVLALEWLFALFDGWIQPLLRALRIPQVPGLGVVASAALILLAGFAASNLVGRRLLNLGNKLLLRVPVVRGIYSTVKQLTDAMFSGDTQAFQQVAIIEWPRHDVLSVGFVTSRQRGADGQELIAIFVPPAPNPTAGFLVLLPPNAVRILEMSVEDGLKLVISGGVFTPNAAGQAEIVAAGNALRALRQGAESVVGGLKS